MRMAQSTPWRSHHELALTTSWTRASSSPSSVSAPSLPCGAPRAVSMGPPDDWGHTGVPAAPGEARRSTGAGQGGVRRRAPAPGVIVHAGHRGLLVRNSRPRTEWMPKGGKETPEREPAQSREDQEAGDARTPLRAPERLTSNSSLRTPEPSPRAGLWQHFDPIA